VAPGGLFLEGLDLLLREVSAATSGYAGGGVPEKYVVAHRLGADHLVSAGIKGDGGAVLPWRRGSGDSGEAMLARTCLSVGPRGTEDSRGCQGLLGPKYRSIPREQGIVKGAKACSNLPMHRSSRAWGKRFGAGEGKRRREQKVAAREVRVRVWVHACRVVDTVWDERLQRYVAAGKGCSTGFVTDWMVLLREPVCDYRLRDGVAAGRYGMVGGDGEILTLEGMLGAEGIVGGEYVGQGLAGQGLVDGEYVGQRREGQGLVDGEHVGHGLEGGEYVVFTAMEVAEKRGRHWVRLPWCSGVRVLEVREVCGLQLEVGAGAEGVAAACGKEGTGGFVDFEGVGSEATRVGKLEVGYLDADGNIVIVHGWPEVGRELEVCLVPSSKGVRELRLCDSIWALEDLRQGRACKAAAKSGVLPNARLVAMEALGDRELIEDEGSEGGLGTDLWGGERLAFWILMDKMGVALGEDVAGVWEMLHLDGVMAGGP
jgi:hypothetical protein